MTIEVDQNVYRGSGWAVALMAGPGTALRVIDAVYISHPDDLDAVDAAIATLKQRQTFKDAEIQANAAQEAPDYEDNDDAFVMRIRGGMMSCTEFSSGMSAKERKRAGVKNPWF